jgi:glycosidase
MRLLALTALVLAACADPRPDDPPAVASWAADAVWYQVFPERFRNGDPSNDPGRGSLPLPDRVPGGWAVTPWGSDWYARADWEREMSDDHYRTVRIRRYGGDLQGVMDRLDYLERLGVNALYFNPLFRARSEHKYDGATFHHVDPHFGPDPAGDLARVSGETADPATWVWTAADSLFLVMLREAHGRGIRVIIDGVFNHTGRDFFAFEDLRRNQRDSPYADWYVVSAFDDPATPADEFDYRGWWGAASLPELADTPDGTDLHPGPKAYVFAATARWMDPDADGDPSDGIDGWRLDVVPDVPIGFWADWNAHVRSLNPDAFTVAEIWEDAAAPVEQGGFSATMNYFGFAFPVKGFLVDGRMPASAFAAALDRSRGEHDPETALALQNLVDSHDTERQASMIVNAGRGLPYVHEDRDVRFDYDWGARSSPAQDSTYLVRAPDADERAIQRLVALFQMTYVGAPMVYYGTEAGMWGADDPDDRQPMVWPDIDYEDRAADPLGRARRPDPVRFDSSLHAFYREAIGLRRAHAPLRRGAFELLLADDERQGLAFARALEDERLVVVLNRSGREADLRLPRDLLDLGPGQGLYPVFSTAGDPAAVRIAPDDESRVTVRLPALTGAVLVRTGLE